MSFICIWPLLSRSAPSVWDLWLGETFSWRTFLPFYFLSILRKMDTNKRQSLKYFNQSKESYWNFDFLESICIQIFWIFVWKFFLFEISWISHRQPRGQPNTVTLCRAYLTTPWSYRNIRGEKILYPCCPFCQILFELRCLTFSFNQN